MKAKAWGLLALWCLVLAAGTMWINARLAISADLRLFMPTPHNEAQRLLVQNVGESPASRLLLLTISGDAPSALAAVSKAFATALGGAEEFEFVANGAEAPTAVPEKLLPYRYLVTDSFDGEPLDADTLKRALADREQDMSSPAAGFIEEWLPRDPTLEVMHLVSRWQPSKEPRHIDDVWFTADGKRALLVAETRAAAFDPDGQTRALDKMRSVFARVRGGSHAELGVSGSGYFSSLVKEHTQREATWIGSIDSISLIILLWAAYRQARFVVLGPLPLLSGGLAGLALVAAIFGSVHGITLAFGFTLIGVAQDYPMHLFSHLRPGESPSRTVRSVWPPLVTGAASTCIAYAAFLVSGVTGLAQLACLTVCGLAVAALTTRFLLPHVIGNVTRGHGGSALLGRLNASIERLPRPLALVVLIPLVCIVVLAVKRQDFWQNDLSRLTPISPDLLRNDMQLRAEMATPDLRYLLVVSGDSAEAVLERLEKLEATLTDVTRAGAIDGFDDAAHYLPSQATQRRRQARLPHEASLKADLAAATHDLDFEDSLFDPFIADVATARQIAPLAPRDLAGTPLALRVSSILFERAGEWHGLVTFFGVHNPSLLGARLSGQPRATLLDLKQASQDLVASQRTHIINCLYLAAVLLITVVWSSLRKLSRVLRVLAPMVLTTLVILAVLRAADVSLSLFHLISLILAAGLGLDYALFFEHAEDDPAEQKRTLHALLVCSVTTLLVFALLAFSSVPILRAMGVTVSLGVISNFLLALLLTRERAGS